jgi:TolB-like protein
MWTVRTIFAVIAVLVASAALSSAQDTELKALAASLASQIKEKGKGPVAITTFANADYGPAFSIFVVDRLSVLLSKGNSDFDVVARDRVDEAFKEINLALAKNFDSSTFARIGKQLGARSLIRGSYTVKSAAGVVSIVAQIVDVETGRIIGGDVAEIRYIKEMLTPRDPAVSGSSVSNQSNAVSVSPGCGEKSTGHYGFTNTKKVTIFTVVVYFKDGSDQNRTITVQPGQTQYIYDFPAGPHNYLVSYRAQVPIMPFPPGAPTMEKDVIYLQGQLYVEPCKSVSLEIK